MASASHVGRPWTRRCGVEREASSSPSSTTVQKESDGEWTWGLRWCANGAPSSRRVRAPPPRRRRVFRRFCSMGLLHPVCYFLAELPPARAARGLLFGFVRIGPQAFLDVLARGFRVRAWRTCPPQPVLRRRQQQANQYPPSTGMDVEHCPGLGRCIVLVGYGQRVVQLASGRDGWK